MYCDNCIDLRMIYNIVKNVFCIFSSQLRIIILVSCSAFGTSSRKNNAERELEGYLEFKECNLLFASNWKKTKLQNETSLRGMKCEKEAVTLRFRFKHMGNC